MTADATPKGISAMTSTYSVGAHFWIEPDDFIGYASDASHGHGLRRTEDAPGSAGPGATVTVLERGEGRHIVRLDWPRTPFGALAPSGTIFYLDTARMESWGPMLAEKAARAGQAAMTMGRLQRAGLV